MVKLIIIADDFTGALDTGVQFSKNTINTMVALYRDLDFSKIDESIQVVVVDTESRHMSKKGAAARIKEVAEKALKAGVSHFYKKTDSVLRGNIGSELLALMEATDSEELMFIPAYPDAKRTTINGTHFLDRIPIDETSFARDPLDPVTSCYIPHILKLQADVNVVITNKNNMDTTCITDNENKTIFVFDAEKNNDMADIAQFLKAKSKLRLTAGCAGFASKLLEMLDMQQSQRKERIKLQGKMLTICGSINEISLKQVKYAENNNFSSITLTPSQKLEKGYFKTLEGKEFINRLVKMLDEDKDIVVKAVDTIKDEENCINHARELQIDEEKIPFIISHNVGNLIREVAARTHMWTLVVFGGDTTVEVINALGLYGVIPKEEIMTGVVLSETMGEGIMLNLVTKSGGLGEENVLLRIKEYLTSDTLKNIV